MRINEPCGLHATHDGGRLLTQWQWVRGTFSAVFGLGLRCIAGPQSFLEDSLRRQEWFAYRLRMPGGAEGLRELLLVALSLGDSASRHAIAHVLDAGDNDWIKHAPEGDSLSRQWARLRTRVQERRPAEEQALPGFSGEQQSYHALLRSCAMLARYTVLLAAHRMVARGQRDGVVLEKLPEAVQGNSEAWMKRVAHADRRGLFLGAPSMVRYLIDHPEVLPNNIPGELDAAGLMEHRDGARLEIRYARKATRPYCSEGVVRV